MGPTGRGHAGPVDGLHRHQLLLLLAGAAAEARRRARVPHRQQDRVRDARLCAHPGPELPGHSRHVRRGAYLQGF